MKRMLLSSLLITTTFIFGGCESKLDLHENVTNATMGGENAGTVLGEIIKIHGQKGWLKVRDEYDEYLENKKVDLITNIKNDIDNVREIYDNFAEETMNEASDMFEINLEQIYNVKYSGVGTRAGHPTKGVVVRSLAKELGPQPLLYTITLGAPYCYSYIDINRYFNSEDMKKIDSLLEDSEYYQRCNSGI